MITYAGDEYGSVEDLVTQVEHDIDAGVDDVLVYSSDRALELRAALQDMGRVWMHTAPDGAYVRLVPAPITPEELAKARIFHEFIEVPCRLDVLKVKGVEFELVSSTSGMYDETRVWRSSVGCVIVGEWLYCEDADGVIVPYAGSYKLYSLVS